MLMKKIKSILSVHLHIEKEGFYIVNEHRFPQLRKGAWICHVGVSGGVRMPLYSVNPHKCHSEPQYLYQRQTSTGYLDGGVALFNLCSSHPSGEQATPLFSMFLLNDFPLGGLTGTLIICLRKMKG